MEGSCSTSSLFLVFKGWKPYLSGKKLFIFEPTHRLVPDTSRERC